MDRDLYLRKVAIILYDKNYVLGEVTTSPFLRNCSKKEKDICKKYFRDIELQGYNYFLTTTKLLEQKTGCPNYEEKYINLLTWVNLLFSDYIEQLEDIYNSDGDFLEIIEEIKRHLKK